MMRKPYLFFQNKIEKAQLRYGNNTAMFNTATLRLKGQLKLIEDVIAIKKQVERTVNIDNLLED